MRKIAVFIGGRANYSSIKSAMIAIDKHPELKLYTIVGASALLERFGTVINAIKEDGFNIDWTFHNIVEGENPTTMAKSTGLGIIEIAMIFDNMKPDFVVVIGDRFEVMAVTLAAAYMNIPIAHTMGGEVSGTIDESIRHAITKFAHVHFPANEDARERIVKMGEDPDMVFNVGCPRMDMVKETLENTEFDEEIIHLFQHKGVGAEFDIDDDFLLVSQHPVTTEFGQNRIHINETLAALDKLKKKTIMLWPNIDAGSDEVSKAIRIFREHNNPTWLHLVKNLPQKIYFHLLNHTLCLVGNSSSGIREGAFIGTPVVNIGTRQNKRVHGQNVYQSDYNADEVYAGIKSQIEHGKYSSESIYGDGHAGEKIADILANVEVNIQKTICY